MKKAFYLISILVLSFVSCQNQESKKVELVYENGTEKIAVEIENGKDFLIYDQPINTNFVLTNIDPVSLVVQGPGIRVLGAKDKSIMRTEIKVPSNYLDKDTLTIKVRYGENYGKGHEFYIPIKALE